MNIQKILIFILLWQALKDMLLIFSKKICSTSNLADKLTVNGLAICCSLVMIFLCQIDLYEHILTCAISYYLMDCIRIFKEFYQVKDIRINTVFLFHHILSIMIFYFAYDRINDRKFTNIFENSMTLIEIGNFVVFLTYHLNHTNVSYRTKTFALFFETLVYIIVRPICLLTIIPIIFNEYHEFTLPFAALYVLSCIWTIQLCTLCYRRII
jgi:hypothetical protein